MADSHENSAEKYTILEEADEKDEKMVGMSFLKKIWKKGRIGQQSKRCNEDESPCQPKC